MLPPNRPDPGDHDALTDSGHQFRVLPQRDCFHHFTAGRPGQEPAVLTLVSSLLCCLRDMLSGPAHLNWEPPQTLFSRTEAEAGLDHPSVDRASPGWWNPGSETAPSPTQYLQLTFSALPPLTRILALTPSSLSSGDNRQQIIRWYIHPANMY